MTYDYDTANISDKILAIGEMEHIYRHAKRSAAVSETDEDVIFYQVLAKQVKDLRRQYMSENFTKVDEKLWCLGKATASLRQLAYESDTGDTETLKKIDALVDSVWGRITGVDLTGCQACRADMAQGDENIVGESKSDSK